MVKMVYWSQHESTETTWPNHLEIENIYISQGQYSVFSHVLTLPLIKWSITINIGSLTGPLIAPDSLLLIVYFIISSILFSFTHVPY